MERKMLQNKAISARKSNSALVTGLSLRANFSWTFVGNVLYAATQWGLLTLLTKLFTPELFGRYALALGISTPILVASALQLRSIYVSEVKNESSFAIYLVLRLVTSVLALILLALLTLLGWVPLHLGPLTLLLGCNQATVMLKDMYQGVMQKHERMDLLALSRVLQGSASMGAALVMALLTQSVIGVVLGMLVARLLCLFLYDIPRARALSGLSRPLVTREDWREALNWSRLWPLARMALPLGGVMLIINLYRHVPRYFLADLGEAAVGYYAAVASIVSLQEMVITALGESAVRQLALRFAASKRSYLALVSRLLFTGAAIGLICVAGAILFGHRMLALLFRPEYAAFAQVLIWLLAAQVVLNVQSFVGYAMTAARWFRAQIWMYGTMLTLLLAASWLLIPKWGGLGAAWATLVSCGITLVVSSMLLIAKISSRKDA
jgi:O-antigen/teichoic acid export membrane protein